MASSEEPRGPSSRSTLGGMLANVKLAPSAGGSGTAPAHVVPGPITAPIQEIPREGELSDMFKLARDGTPVSLKAESAEAADGGSVPASQGDAVGGAAAVLSTDADDAAMVDAGIQLLLSVLQQPDQYGELVVSLMGPQISGLRVGLENLRPLMERCPWAASLPAPDVHKQAEQLLGCFPLLERILQGWQVDPEFARRIREDAVFARDFLAPMLRPNPSNPLPAGQGGKK